MSDLTNNDLIDVYPTKDFLEYYTKELYSSNSDLLNPEGNKESDHIKFTVTQTNLSVTSTDYILEGTSGSLICSLSNEELDNSKLKRTTSFDGLKYGFSDFDDTLNWGTDTGVAAVAWEKEDGNPLLKVAKNKNYFVFERWVGEKCNFKALTNGTLTAPNFESMLEEGTLLYKDGWMLGIAYLNPDEVRYSSTSDYIHIENDYSNTLKYPKKLYPITEKSYKEGVENKDLGTIVSHIKVYFEALATFNQEDISEVVSYNSIMLYNTDNDLVAYVGYLTQTEYINESGSFLLSIELEDVWKNIIII